MSFSFVDYIEMKFGNVKMHCEFPLWPLILIKIIFQKISIPVNFFQSIYNPVGFLTIPQMSSNFTYVTYSI